MGLPLPPLPTNPQPVRRPARSSADMVVSILVLVAAVITVGAGAVMGVFSLAFLDYCPPESCSVDAAVTAVTTTIVVAALAGVVGLVLTVIRLRTRAVSWPFAVGTLALVIAVLFVGALVYTKAVNY